MFLKYYEFHVCLAALLASRFKKTNIFSLIQLLGNGAYMLAERWKLEKDQHHYALEITNQNLHKTTQIRQTINIVKELRNIVGYGGQVGIVLLQNLLVHVTNV